jgi:hypothetical protein
MYVLLINKFRISYMSEIILERATLANQKEIAECLYLSMGFIIESWLDNYFGDGEPRLMLVKK